MIFTVFAGGADVRDQWRAEFLEHSWTQARQGGELVRLVAARGESTLPWHALAHVVSTDSWNPHPYLDDEYAGYDTPAAVLEWLTGEAIDGTVLLVPPDCVLVRPIAEEVAPGRAIATVWPEMPVGNGGPFGLGERFSFLEGVCVNRALKLDAVRLPLLIHASDLARIAPRWLELTSIIRAAASDHLGKLPAADLLAYAIAAAETRIVHDARKLAVDTSEDPCEDACILTYRTPVESTRGEIVWDPEVYQAWDSVDAGRGASGNGARLLEMLGALASDQTSGAYRERIRPTQRPGVRHAQVCDHVYLEVPGRADGLSLNPTAAAVWQLCDQRRSVAAIIAALEVRFDAPADALRDGVEAVVRSLRSAGAIQLEVAPR